MRVNREKTRIIICFCVGLCFMAGQALAQQTSYSFTTKDRDPMAPLVDNNGNILIPKEFDVGGLNLKGIIYSAAMPLAIINDQVLAEGDTLGEYTIVDITEKSVSLQKADKGFVLKLEE